MEVHLVFIETTATRRTTKKGLTVRWYANGNAVSWGLKYIWRRHLAMVNVQLNGNFN